MKPGYALGLTLSLCISTAPIAAQTARMAHPSLPLRSPLALRPDRCHPPLDATQPQYIIGYGSLMETASKERTAPTAGENLPILLRGFERGWFMRGSSDSPTTYLGAIANSQASMNAVIYRVPLLQEVEATDIREGGYCRFPVNPQQIVMLDRSVTPQGQIWIYVVPPDRVATPSADFPIVQSYVESCWGGAWKLRKILRSRNLPRCV